MNKNEIFMCETVAMIMVDDNVKHLEANDERETTKKIKLEKCVRMSMMNRENST